MARKSDTACEELVSCQNGGTRSLLSFFKPNKQSPSGVDCVDGKPKKDALIPPTHNAQSKPSWRFSFKLKEGKPNNSSSAQEITVADAVPEIVTLRETKCAALETKTVASVCEEKGSIVVEETDDELKEPTLFMPETVALDNDLVQENQLNESCVVIEPDDEQVSQQPQPVEESIEGNLVLAPSLNIIDTEHPAIDLTMVPKIGNTTANLTGGTLEVQSPELIEDDREGELKDKEDLLQGLDSFPNCANKKTLLSCLQEIAKDSDGQDVFSRFTNILQQQNDLERKANEKTLVAEARTKSVWSQAAQREKEEKAAVAKKGEDVVGKSTSKSSATEQPKKVESSKSIQSFFKPLGGASKKEEKVATSGKVDCTEQMKRKRPVESDESCNLRRSKRLQTKEETACDYVEASAGSDDEDECYVTQEKKTDNLKRKIPRIALEVEDAKCTSSSSKPMVLSQNAPQPKPAKAPHRNAKVYNSCLWTDKYHPASSKDVIGGNASILELYTWLSSWKHQHQRIVKKISSQTSKKKKRVIDSDDSDDDSDDDDDLLCNTVLLTGEVGGGATASLLACTNELGFKVLELNGSSCRSSKEIYQHFGEALQSHQVRHKFNSSEENANGNAADVSKTDQPKMSMASFFGQRGIQPKDNQNKTKHVDASGKRGLPPLMPYNDTMSLILLEQADCVFEDYDRGFWQAINDLRCEAKRPIVLTSNDPTIVSHLEGAEFIHIHISRPSTCPQSVVAALQLMCLVEKGYVSKEAMTALLHLVSFDIRQAITTLHFLCESQTLPLHTMHAAGRKSTMSRLMSEKMSNNMNETGNDFTIDKDKMEDDDTSRVGDASMSEKSSEKEDSGVVCALIQDKSAEVMDYVNVRKPIHCSTDKMTRQTATLIRRKEQRYYSFIKKQPTESSGLDKLCTLLDERAELDAYGMRDAIISDCHDDLWVTTCTDSLADKLPISYVNSAKEHLEQEVDKIRQTYQCLLDQVWEETGESEMHLSCTNPPECDRSHIVEVMNKVDLLYSLAHRPFVLDLLPTLKLICVTEDLKKLTSSKRIRRFLHYLDGIFLFFDDELQKELIECNLSTTAAHVNKVR